MDADSSLSLHPHLLIRSHQVGFLFQIIEKGGPIPWDELTLPEGRTKKAVQVMVDKEKQKIKKARAQEAGTEGSGGEADDKSPVKAPAKKPKTTKVSLTVHPPFYLMKSFLTWSMSAAQGER